MNEIELHYGIKDESLVHISQVESGLVCNCVCPSCKKALVAKKGRTNEHHFAHFDNESCKYSVETALHLASKEILEAAGSIKLPAVVVASNSGRIYQVISQAKTYKIDSVLAEHRVGEIVPDLIVRIGGRELLIEIFVTHRVNDLKKNKIEALDISAIEIDFSQICRDLKFNSIRELVIESIENKKWIYNTEEEKARKQYKSLCDRINLVIKGGNKIRNCPRKTGHDSPYFIQKQPYLTLLRDCLRCRYAVEVDSDGVYCCKNSEAMLGFIEKHMDIALNHGVVVKREARHRF